MGSSSADMLLCGRWHGLHNMGILLLFVGLMSLQLATFWPLMKYVTDGVFGEVLQCWELWTTNPTNNPVSNRCDNKMVTLKTFVKFFYFLIVRCILMVNLVDMMMVLVMRIHNFNVANSQEFQLHTPYCFYVCAFYVLTNRLHSRYVPRHMIHILNFVVFSAYGIRTLMSRYINDRAQKSSVMSLYAARFICFFVVITEYFVCKMYGFGTWAGISLDHHVIQLGVLYTNLFAFYILDIVYKTLFPDSKTFI